MDAVAIVTARFGPYDDIRPQAEQDREVEWICVTDSPNDVPPPWKVVFGGSDEHPNMAAKRYKCLPPFPHRHIIWIDANVSVTSPSFAREALSYRRDGIALFRHPRRDCIFDECEASLGAESQGGKYDQWPLREQVDHYRGEGYPPNAGLYACGIIASDRHDARVWELGAAWMKECERWSVQDQLSFPVVCRRLGIHPGTFPFRQLERQFYGPDYIGNRWLRFYNHLQ